MTTSPLSFPSREAFDAWHAHVNAALGYPSEDGLTLAYTSAQEGEDGRFYAPINALCPAEFLPPDE